MTSEERNKQIQYDQIKKDPPKEEAVQAFKRAPFQLTTTKRGVKIRETGS